MHPNAALLDRLFTALDRHDPETMASCYASDARFRDIAFDLEGRDRIKGMWRMICSGDIRAEFEVLEADDRSGRVRLVDTYTFGASREPPRPGRPVRNAIESRFAFENGLIKSQTDDCDPREWARQAMGGLKGFLAGRIRLLRSIGARKKLETFVAENPA